MANVLTDLKKTFMFEEDTLEEVLKGPEKVLRRKHGGVNDSKEGCTSSRETTRPRGI